MTPLSGLPDIQCWEQASVLPGLAQGVELIKGDVYQFESIKPAFAESTVLLIATGSTPIFDPLGPYNTDYQACY